MASSTSSRARRVAPTDASTWARSMVQRVTCSVRPAGRANASDRSRAASAGSAATALSRQSRLTREQSCARPSPLALPTRSRASAAVSAAAAVSAGRRPAARRASPRCVVATATPASGPGAAIAGQRRLRLLGRLRGVAGGQASPRPAQVEVGRPDRAAQELGRAVPRRRGGVEVETDGALAVLESSDGPVGAEHRLQRAVPHRRAAERRGGPVTPQEMDVAADLLVGGLRLDVLRGGQGLLAPTRPTVDVGHPEARQLGRPRVEGAGRRDERRPGERRPAGARRDCAHRSTGCWEAASPATAAGSARRGRRARTARARRRDRRDPEIACSVVARSVSTSPPSRRAAPSAGPRRRAGRRGRGAATAARTRPRPPPRRGRQRTMPRRRGCVRRAAGLRARAAAAAPRGRGRHGRRHERARRPRRPPDGLACPPRSVGCLFARG